MEGAFETTAAAAPGLAAVASSPRRPWRRAVPLIASVLVIGIGALVAGRMSVPEASRQVVRSSHLLPEGTAFQNAVWNAIDISSDGERFVYSGLDGLVVRERVRQPGPVGPQWPAAHGPPQTIRRVDVLPDGRFVGVLGELNPATGEPVEPAFQIHIVQQRFEELKRLVPTPN